MILTCDSISDLPQVAKQIVAYGKDFSIWLFNGSMGAGKTTTIKSICEFLGSVDNVSSPTFSLVNEYNTTKNECLYHFDFYRIESEMEAVEIGCDEYFYSNNLCLIEWSEKIPSLIPPKYVEISIKLVGNNQREFHLSKNG